MRITCRKTTIVSASSATELHAAKAAASHEPKDALVDIQDFIFSDGKSLGSLKLHYLTLGTPSHDANLSINNSVLLLDGTAGSAADFTQPGFFDALYGAGQSFDLDRYFLVICDAIGAGDSSKPSDGLHCLFPHYGYEDQVRAQHLLLERIGIKHLHLLLGTSSKGDLLAPFSAKVQAKRAWWPDMLAEGESLAPELLQYINLDHHMAADLMTRNVFTATETTPVAQIADLLLHNHIKRVPILCVGHFIGMVSRADIIRAVAGSVISEKREAS